MKHVTNRSSFRHGFSLLRSYRMRFVFKSDARRMSFRRRHPLRKGVA